MIDPQRSFELVEKAEAANDIGRFETAQSFAAQAVAFNPDWCDAYGSLARSCLGLKQFKEAEKHCLAGLAYNPDDTWLLKLLVITTRCLGSPSKGIKPAKRILEIAPESSEAHSTYGDVLKDCSRFADAISHYEEARRLDPVNANAISGLGYCYLGMGKPKVAESCYRDSLSLQPNDARDLNNLGVALQQQGKLKDAAVAFKAAVTVDPTLDISKSNAKDSIGAYLSIGGGALFIYLMAKLAFVGMKGSVFAFGNANGLTHEQQMQIGSVIGIVILCILVAYALFARGRQRSRKAALENADPQILEFYKAVCNDPNVK